MSSKYGASSSESLFSTIPGRLSYSVFQKKFEEERLAHSTQVILDFKIDKNLTHSQQDAKISQLVEELIKKFLVVFCMQRKLETNIPRLFSNTSWYKIKNHYLKLFTNLVNNWK